MSRLHSSEYLQNFYLFHRTDSHNAYQTKDSSQNSQVQVIIKKFQRSLRLAQSFLRKKMSQIEDLSILRAITKQVTSSSTENYRLLMHFQYPKTRLRVSSHPKMNLFFGYYRLYSLKRCILKNGGKKFTYKNIYEYYTSSIQVAGAVTIKIIARFLK